MKALEPYDPLFYEEPVCSAQNTWLTQAAAATSVPLATGERMFSIEQFRDLMEQRCIGIVQPDCSHAGGISGMLNIARLAEAYEVSFAPHCPLGPIALAACLQVDAVSINFVFQETSMGIHYNTEGEADLLDYLKDPSVLEVDAEGHVELLSGPGLGIELDEDKIRKFAVGGHCWKDREWELKDGTPTTW
eukprot:TRINITY_DN7869_c0_g2_i1.p2 TRINITY_DN7869_c0_g2~~TRINITY_DN7869_c0_g2_i1.p2  ORF type:complete len:190 (-),score=34.56 TRINITY_DN7869_c0_g2_i1:211-780(-)